ncbi:PIG-L deacetylase family protein [Catalinimonas niigatensis]|uniref:PIG-L deacetylase family protein n=1 Tax=Catalinimonas niigatensis TaxID=1397264 RepID=UPI002665A4CE|nr:PIG-L family deacetylase [Catalinimonas niigatensis]WPP53718.1 PIG-L family deacetylase [Catalinimonas niigatensis]
MMKTAIAIAAHPDDIEFMMAGTLLLLKRAGYEIHYMNLSSGSGGSLEYDADMTQKIRLREAKQAADILGAHFHPPLCDDLEILYELKTLRQLTAIIREVRPSVLLTHSPQDYMEDHCNACRLAVTAAFARGMPNFESVPARPTEPYDCTIYHAMPHGLRDSLRRKIIPGAFVNTTAVQAIKMEALQAHQSQQQWLDVSQKLNSYLQSMEDMALTMGRMSEKFTYAEGWRRHLHYGFCDAETDPLQDLREDYLINVAYEQSLEKGY